MLGQGVICSLLETLSTMYRDATSKCLPAFMPDLTEPPLSTHFASFSSSVLLSWASVLSSVMQADTTKDTLADWVRSSTPHREIAESATSMMQECHALFAKEPNFQSILHLSRASSFLCACSQFFAMDPRRPASLETCQTLQKEYQGVMRNLPDNLPSELGANRGKDILQSPLLVDGGDYELGVVRALHATGVPIVKSFATDFHGAIGKLDLDKVCFEDLSLDDVKHLSGSSLDDGVFKEAMSWATKTSDTLLFGQLTVLHAVHSVLKAVASVQVMAREVLVVGGAGGKISEEQATAVKDMRARYAAFQSMIDGSPSVFAALVTDASHIVVLDGILKREVFQANLADCISKCVLKFSTRWSSDMTVLCDALDQACPSWEPVRDTLLDEKIMVKAMVDNERYSSIAPLMNEVRNQIKLVKSIHSDRRGALVDAGLIQRAVRCSDFAVETVAFTFYLFKVSGTTKDS